MDWLFYASAARVLSGLLVMATASLLRPQPASRRR
jgi:hypothetical protein